MKKIIMLLCISTLTLMLSAKAPIKFGKITEDLLEMTTYEPDTTAVAVILCDYGEFDPDMFEFTRTLRIKILKKDGLSYANRNLFADEKGMVRGITYNLVDGKIEETKIDKKENVFRERIYDDRYRLRISMPNVKVGSVIDIEYTYDGLPGVWYFQEQIPVVHSELVIYDNPYVNFSKNFYGFVPLDVNDSYRWAAFDVPAFKVEPYMNDYLNYVSKFEIEISSIRVPELGINKNYATSWDAIRIHLDQSPYFGGKFDGNFFISSIAKDIKAKTETTEERIKEAVKTIKTVKWNDSKNLFCSSYSLSDRFDKKIANSAELNIMLIELLNALDIETKPVVLSTRDNGILSVIHPSLDKLNYIVAYAKTADKTYLLDATDKYLDPFLLPERCLNYQGRVLCKEMNDWLTIKASAADDKTYMYALRMDSTGSITGTFNCRNSGYAARDRRANYHSFSSEEDFIINFEKNHSMFSVDKYELSGLNELDESLIEKYDIKMNTRGNMVGSMILLNPILDEQMTENPFKLEKREYPVDFIHPINRTIIFSLQLPDNAVVEELPKPTMLTLPDKSITCIYNTVHNGNNIQIMYKLNISKPLFNEGEYAYVKQFFSTLAQKHGENIIINMQPKSDTATL